MGRLGKTRLIRYTSLPLFLLRMTQAVFLTGFAASIIRAWREDDIAVVILLGMIVAYWFLANTSHNDGNNPLTSWYDEKTSSTP